MAQIVDEHWRGADIDRAVADWKEVRALDDDGPAAGGEDGNDRRRGDGNEARGRGPVEVDVDVGGRERVRGRILVSERLEIRRRRERNRERRERGWRLRGDHDRQLSCRARDLAERVRDEQIV